MLRVVVEREARANLRLLYLDLRSRNPGSPYPDRWFADMREAVLDLAQSAERCGIACEDRFFAETIRHRLVGAYKILFTIRQDRVHVLHVRHPHQDPSAVRP